MEKIKTPAYHIYKILFICVFFMALLSSCSKDPGVQPNPTPNPPPVNSKPSGVIESFELVDTLVGFNISPGTIIKWLVSGTNNFSEVTFNGIKVPFSSSFSTGPIKQNTTYTLAINNGVQASVTLKAADSITTLLWNGGKFWKKVRSEFIKGTTWTDTLIDPVIADQRIYFSLRRTSTIIQASSNQNVSPPDGGPFVVNLTQLSFTWQGHVFIIGELTSKTLVVTFQETLPNGSAIIWRDTYDAQL